MIAQIDVAIDLPEFNDLGRSVTADLPLTDHFFYQFSATERAEIGRASCRERV